MYGSYQGQGYQAGDFDTRKYVGKVNIVVGGALCQAFSMVGHRLGFEDARGTLFYEFARVVLSSE